MISSNEKSELLSLMRAEVASMMNIILNGQTKGAGKDTESIDAMFPGMNTITDRPLVEPYGLHSRAPDGTLSLTARIGEHAGSRYVIGHRDANRPDVDTGESVLYSVGGYQVRVFNKSIGVGKDGTYETAVVGETLCALFTALLAELAIHTHFTSAPGAPTSPPIDAANFVQLNTNYVANQKILAKDGGRF